MTFKKGDIVRVIDAYPGSTIPNGTIGVVTVEQGTSPTITVELDTFGIRRWYPKRFALVPPPKAMKKPKAAAKAAIIPAKVAGVFNKGDKVVAIDIESHGLLKQGTVYTVSAGQKDQARYNDDLINVEGLGGASYARRFKHYEEPGQARPAKKAIVDGCQVACIDVRNSDLLRLKGKYYVQNVRGNSVKLVGIGVRYSIDRFRWCGAPKAVKKPVAKVNWPPVVGQKVYIVAKSGVDHVGIMDKYVQDGEEYTVKNIGEESGVVCYYVQVALHRICYWSIDALSPTPAKPIAHKDWIPTVGDEVYVTGKDMYHNPVQMDKFINDGIVYKIKEVYAGFVRLNNTYGYEKSSLTLKKSGYRPPAPKPVPKPVPKPAIIQHELDLREDLFSKGGASICSFGFEFEDGSRSLQYNAPCHAGLRVYYGGKGPKKVTQLAYCIRREKRFITGKEEAHKAYVDYIINKSPWAVAFLTKDIEEAYTKDILMNIDANHNVVCGAAVALRVGTEKQGRIDTFKMLVDKGVSGHAAWLISFCYVPNGKGYVPSFSGGGHDVIDCYRSWKGMIQFFSKGYFRKGAVGGKTYREYSYYDGFCEYVAGGNSVDTIRTWMEKNVKAKTSGEGFNKVTSINEESLLEAAKLIEELLNKDKE